MLYKTLLLTKKTHFIQAVSEDTIDIIQKKLSKTQAEALLEELKFSKILEIEATLLDNDKRQKAPWSETEIDKVQMLEEDNIEEMQESKHPTTF